MITALALALAVTSPVSTPGIHTGPIPNRSDSAVPDGKAIEALLTDYTRAVSTKDQTLFESILLNTHIPFSAATNAVRDARSPTATQDYESFRKGVFEGPALAQHFLNVHIEQDGPLAAVTLVYINTTSSGSYWGWKTMQLLKVGGRWKIASEFFTGH